MQWTKQEVNKVKQMRKAGKTIREIAKSLNRTYDSVRHILKRIDIPKVEKPKISLEIDKEIESYIDDEIAFIKKHYSTAWKPTKQRKKSNKEKSFKSYLVIADVHVPYQNDTAIRAVLQLMEDITFDGFIILGDFMDMTPISHWLHEKNQRKSLEGLRMKEDYLIGNMLLDEFDRRLPKNCDKIFVYGNHERFAYDFEEKYPMLEGLFNPTIELKLKERNYKVYEGINPTFKIGKLVFTHGLYHNKHFLAKHIDEFKTNILIGHLHTPRLRLANSIAKELPIMGASVGCLCDLNPDYNRNKPNKTCHGFAVVYFYDDGYFDIDIKRIIKGKFVFNGKLYDGNK